MTVPARVSAATEAAPGRPLSASRAAIPMDPGVVRVMLLAFTVAVVLATVGPSLFSDAVLLDLMQLVGAAGATAILAQGWRTATGDDRAMRRAALHIVLAWVALHVARTVATLNDTDLPEAVSWSILAVMAVLIVRAWPATLGSRLSRSDAIALSLDSAVVLAAVTALGMWLVGEHAFDDPVIGIATAVGIGFVGVTASVILMGLALEVPRGPGGWLAIVASLPVVGVATVWVLLADGPMRTVALLLFATAGFVAAYGAATWTSAVDPSPSYRSLARRLRSSMPIAAVALAPPLLIVNELSHHGTMLLTDAMLGVVLAIGVVRQTFLLRDREEILRAAEEAAEGEREALVDLRANEERLQALLKHSSDVFLIMSPEGTVQYESPAVEKVLGYLAGERIGRSIFELAHPDDVAFARAALAEVIATPGAQKTIEMRARHADGSWRTVEASGWNRLDDPVVGGIVINYRDITERKSLERQLVHDAFHDPLTGLANRALFADRAQHALARRSSAADLAVLMMDVDDLKTINDSLGHSAGDLAIKAVAERLRGSVRPEDTVARVGGDEFAILVESATPEAVDVISHRILDTMRSPFQLGEMQVHLGGSIGVAFSTNDTRTADELLRNADVAMYTAKTRGKGRAERFEAAMHTAALARLELKADLERALERDELRLRYQPVYALETGEIDGFEALLRWKHPTRGEVMPLDFVPLAEETGLILPIGNWVMEQACRQAVAWSEAAGRPIHIGVNVSPRQLHESSLAEWTRQALASTGLRPDQLILELTESGLMQDDENQLVTLKGLGVKMALDDFGTGYSSLAYLARFPIDILKIDRSFVAELGGDREVPPLVRSVVQLGAALKMATVAEGIETDDQRRLLREMGVEFGQGFLFARPMDVIAATRLLVGHADAAVG